MQKRRTKDSQMLSTRVPTALRRRLRLYGVEHEGQIQDFVREALEEALRKKKRRSRLPELVGPEACSPHS
jgi:hypothetical protein